MSMEFDKRKALLILDRARELKKESDDLKESQRANIIKYMEENGVRKIEVEGVGSVTLAETEDWSEHVKGDVDAFRQERIAFFTAEGKKPNMQKKVTFRSKKII